MFLIQEHILYRDGLMLVLNKPAGYPVHQGGGQTTSFPPLTTYFKELCFGLNHVPQLIHRLDKDTSGCLLLGRHPKAIRMLNRLMQQGFIQKTYVALVTGLLPLGEAGTIKAPLAKQTPKPHLWWMKVDYEQGVEAITAYQVLSHQGDNSLIQLQPITGRTHQLRVHCTHMGWPIIGDKIYNPTPQPAHQKMCLHASQLSISLSAKKPNIEVESPLPEYFTGS